MLLSARIIGLLVVVQGIAGLVAPEAFAHLIRAIQTPPVIYLAAVVRVAFGVVLFSAAPSSRLPTPLKALGALIAIGGLLTPFVGIQFAEVVLDWWSQSTTVVRAWAVAALLLGIFIVYATAPKRSAA